MKKQFLILKKGFHIALFSFPFLYSIPTNAQLYAAADFNIEHSNSFSSHTENSSKLDLNGPWFSYLENGALEKVEIYKNGIIVESKFGKEAELILLQTKIEELNLRLNADRAIIQSLYANLSDYNADKKIILDNYKIVMLDLQMQLFDLNDLDLFQNISDEIKTINRNMLNFYLSDSSKLQNDLATLVDPVKIKNLLLN
jgi:hypothetical protein